MMHVCAEYQGWGTVLQGGRWRGDKAAPLKLLKDEIVEYMTYAHTNQTTRDIEECKACWDIVNSSRRIVIIEVFCSREWSTFNDTPEFYDTRMLSWPRGRVNLRL